MSKENNRVVLRRRPVGTPQSADLQLITEKRPKPGAGQVLVRQTLLSLDPATRNWMDADTNSYAPPIELGQTISGLGVGVVEQSNSPDLPVGTRVSGMWGWTEYALSPAEALSPLPSASDGPADEAFLGVLGLAGATAYYGLMEVAKAQPGESLVVTAAAGSVGSLVGQIAKAEGLRVVGIAGTEEKCRWLTEELGFDAALNHRSPTLKQELEVCLPEGADIHFENVGGPLLNLALETLKPAGRLIVCGLIAEYNDTAVRPGPSLLPVLKRRLSIRGFTMTDHLAEFPRLIEQVLRYFTAGQLKYRLDIVDGLENAPAAFLKLFDGSNTGKLAIRL